jgi:hypothetical protein
VPTTKDGNARSSSPVEGDTACADNGGWRRGSVGAAGGVGDETLRGCGVEDSEVSDVFLRNSRWAANSASWKPIEISHPIPWAAKQGGLWNPIVNSAQFGETKQALRYFCDSGKIMCAAPPPSVVQLPAPWNLSPSSVVEYQCHHF